MTELKRTLGPLMLWGLGVGYVISGEYFGWNLGLPKGGTYGMLAATGLVTVLYVTFVLSYTELACALPKAGGAFVYAERALGPYPGFLAGWVQIIEFVFAPPAIAMAIAAYVGQRYPSLDPKMIAIGAYFVFTGLNVWGVRQAATFELVVTVLAVAELLIFIGVVGPSFSLEAFTRDPLPHGWGGAIACIPFAIWFYLGLEGVANAAEEAKDPHRDVVRGFGSAIFTLVALALGVFFAGIGVGGWAAVVYPPGSTTESDAPLPLALAQVVAPSSSLYLMLLGIGLLGLIASFHGIILAAGRATMVFGTAGYLPKAIGRIDPRTSTPIAALVLNLGVGITAILSGRTAEIITLSCFGAASLYVLGMASVLALRVKEPELSRPYRAPFYPFFPLIALVLGALCLGALTWSTPDIAVVFLGMVGIGSVLFWFARKKQSPTQHSPSGASRS